MPEPAHPEDGHGLNKVAVGEGVHNDDFFSLLRYRIAYHGLIDDDEGYIPGAQIQLMHMAFRYYGDRDDLEIEYIDLIDVFSVSPRDRFFKPSSWKVKTGFTQKDFRSDQDNLVYQLSTGTGYAYRYHRLGVCYFMLDADLQVAGGYNDSYVFGAASSLGVMTTPHDRWKSVLQAKVNYFPLSEEFWTYAVTWDHNIQLGQNKSLALEFSHAVHDDYTLNEGKLLVNFYF